jgi:hypothetical protein
VRVHCDEGVATHIGPEPCADVREDVGEASAGVRVPVECDHGFRWKMITQSGGT